MSSTSTAISAQGSTLKIGSSTGSAASISGVQLGFPTVVEATAHGFSNGDVVTIAGATGPTNLNGTYVVSNVLPNSFSIELDTTGGTSFAGTVTATPVTFTKIGNVATFKGFDGKVNKLDTTTLDSTAKEWIPGLQDNGAFTFDVMVDRTDVGQLALRAALSSRLIKPFKLTLPNGKTATWNAFVESFPEDGGVDKVLTASVSLIITGPVTFA